MTISRKKISSLFALILNTVCACSVYSAQAQTTSIFTDTSLTAKTVAAYGNAAVVAGQSKFAGPTGVFDGAGDYLVVSPSPLESNPKVFTIEAWVYMTGIPANGWPIVSQSANGVAGEQQLFVSGSNGGAANLNKLRFSRGADATNPIDLVGTTTLPLNQWVHVALSVDGATAKLFVNGNLDSSASLTTGWIDTAQPFYVATTLNTSAPQNQSFAKGKVSDLRITKGSARYRNFFIPYATERLDSSMADNNYGDVELLLSVNGSDGAKAFFDLSPSQKNISSSGDSKIVTAQSKFGGASAYFDGAGDYLRVPSSSTLDLESTYTIECWVYPTSLSSNFGILKRGFYSTSGQTWNGLAFSVRWLTTNKLRFYFYGTTLANEQYIDVSSALTVNAWTHIAMVRNGSVGTVFINGVQAGTISGLNLPSPSNLDLNIGVWDYSAANEFFPGYLDDVRITKGVARYVSNFTPSEIPSPPIKTGDAQWGNVSLLLNANGVNASKNISDLSSSSNKFSVVGDAQISTAQSKFGGASALFDGNGDYISTGYKESLNLSNTNFTIEGWVYPTSYTWNSVYGTILSKRSSGGDFDYSLWAYGANKELIFTYGTSATARVDIGSGANTLPLNAWSHFAVTCDGSLIKLFLNGNFVASKQLNGSLRNRAIALEIGKSLFYGDSQFSGYIDDLRITKGVARYISNFTPPTTQLEPPRFVKDPYSNKVSLLLLSGAPAIDSVTPFVASSSKQTNADATLSSITLNFNKTMEPTSFTAGQFSMVDSTQKIIPIDSITKMSNTSYKVGFASPLLAGTYTFTALPQLVGANGLPLDQNKNGVGGELTDAFSLAVTVAYASPSAVVPTVNSSGTGTGLSVSWPAYVKPVNGKDISKYRVYVSTNPYTNISQATKVLEVAGTVTSANITGLLSNTTYYVSVVAVDAGGAFNSVVAPVTVKTLGATESSITYTYNTAGQILTEDGPRTDVNDVTTYTYNTAGNRATMTNALGHIVSYTSYDGAGRLLSMTDANGIVSNFTYSDRGWLLSSTIKHPTSSALDSITTYTYDAVGQMLTMTLPNGYQLGYEYDDARRLTAIKNPAGERIEYTLDAAGNRTQQKIKSSSGLIVYSVVQAFDELSRVMSITGNHNQNEQHKYDVNDNNTEVTDGRSNKTQQTYDALNRISKIIDPNLKETAFTYDSQNRIKTVTDARGNITTYTYDGLGNLVSQSSPDTGVTRFSYDAAGNRTSMVDARGVVVNYAYDALNRLISVTYPAAATENITYTYDVTATDNYGLGRLNKITVGTTAVSYKYSHLGLINQKTSAVSNITKSVTYVYDKAGNLTSMTYPSGRVVNYTLDSAGRVQAVKTKVNSSSAEQTVISAANYLPFGPVKNYTYGNGLTHTLTYDNDYRLTDIVLGGLMVRNYSYDAADNITKITDSVSANKTQNFTYDNLDRLTSANGIYGYQAFSYDAVGNRTGLLFDNGTSIQSDTYVYDTASNRLSRIDKTNAGLASGTRNFSYDNAGNLTQGTGDDGSTQAFTFNNSNRLNTAKVNAALVGTYTYNALGQRVSKTYADATKELFHYNEAGQLLSVTNASGTTIREYIYNGATLVGYVNAGILTYVHNDHLNTPQVVTAQNQSVLWMADYEPFGKAKLNASNTIAFSARFPGQYLDSETGIYYNYFRDYDPSIGRYIESDPIGLEGGINTYAYVGGNPIIYTDPNGLLACFNVNGAGYCTDKRPDPRTYIPESLWPLIPYFEDPKPGNWVSQPNGNLCGTPAKQDNVCSLPNFPLPFGMVADLTVLPRCKKHDDCYAANACTASSWGSSALGGNKACNQCNSDFFK